MATKLFPPWRALILCLSVGLWPALGCDGGAEGSSPPTGSGDDAQSTMNDQRATASGESAEGSAGSERDAAPATCDASADAVFETEAGELRYSNATLTADAMHSPSGGCINTLSIVVEQGGGCALNLTLQTLDGAWTLSEGSLVVDEACGAELADALGGTYALDPDTSTGGLAGQPTVASSDTSTCHPGADLDFTGLAHFEDGDTSLVLNLNELKITGDIQSSLGEEVACPGAIPTCVDRTCGSDAYGEECGACPEGEACVDGGCRVWNCPPGAPFGTKPGENLTDLELRDCDGNPVFLHELCGADAAYFNLLAGW